MQKIYPAKNSFSHLFVFVALLVLISECVLLPSHIFAQESLEEKAWRLIRSGALLVDVRSPAEYAEGHLPGAVNIPDYQIKERISEFGNNKDRQIVVYCRTGIRAMAAELKLDNFGYKNILNAYSYIDMLKAQ